MYVFNQLVVQLAYDLLLVRKHFVSIKRTNTAANRIVVSLAQQGSITKWSFVVNRL